MALVQSLITQDKYGIKCPYSMQPKGICVHNTANDAPAKNEISYMKSNNMEVSFHVAIDDVEAIQGIPFNRNAWACGDGENGEGNRNYIQIEICYSKSGGIKFNNAEKRAAKEIAALLKQYGWTINNVKKHQDFSNKYCPHRTLDNGWKRFLTMIEVELSNLNKPANTVKYRVVTGSFSSLDNANARVKELKAKGFDSFILAE
jgi:N-acetylmuramoyl-L-alanine amidase CwlA